MFKNTVFTILTTKNKTSTYFSQLIKISQFYFKKVTLEPLKLFITENLPAVVEDSFQKLARGKKLHVKVRTVNGRKKTVTIDPHPTIITEQKAEICPPTVLPLTSEILPISVLKKETSEATAMSGLQEKTTETSTTSSSAGFWDALRWNRIEIIDRHQREAMERRISAS